MALTLRVGVSADASRAFALATQGGIAAELSPSLSATSVASVLSAPDLATTTLLELRSAWLFQSGEPCLADFFGATGAPTVSSDFVLAAALSALVAACDGPAKHTNSPVASINAECPLASIFIWQSPHLPALKGAMRSRCVSAPGQKTGIFGRQRAKPG